MSVYIFSMERLTKKQKIVSSFICKMSSKLVCDLQPPLTLYTNLEFYLQKFFIRSKLRGLWLITKVIRHQGHLYLSRTTIDMWQNKYNNKVYSMYPTKGLYTGNFRMSFLIHWKQDTIHLEDSSKWTCTSHKGMNQVYVDSCLQIQFLQKMYQRDID